MSITKTLALGFFSLLFAASRALAQDPVPIYPQNYKVLSKMSGSASSTSS